MRETELTAMDLEFHGLPLLDSPWSVRFARGTRGRRALEVYNAGLLLDVMVESALAPQLLRGARRGSRDGRRSVLAWGHVPRGGELPLVTLGRASATPAETIATAGGFWLALAEFDADRVTARGTDGSEEHLRVRAGWSR